MRNFISTLALLTTITLHAQVPSYVPTNGLVGWWPFDGNANDESGNGNNGAVTGPTLSVDRFGLQNNCYHFNNNGNITIQTLQFNNYVSSGFTLSYWFTMEDSISSALRHFLFSNYDGINGLQIEYYPGPSIVFRHSLRTATANPAEINYNHVFTNANSWKHAVFIWQPPTLTTYINGVMVNQSSNPGITNLSVCCNIVTKFGSQWNNTSPHKGKLDDIGIWNRALTPAEVLALFYSSSGAGSSLHTCGAPNVHNPDLSYGSVTDQDGNVYKTIVIGTQEWMAENLKVGRYQNGDAIPVVEQSSWAGLTSGASCWFNSDSASYDCPYGRLYNWYAVTDSRNVCPSGWHVPTDQEWTVLTDQLGGEAIAGSKMKPPGTDYWLPNPVATNESGFSALGGEYIDFIGQWGPNVNLQINGLYWSATLEGGGAWARRVMGAYENIQRENHVVNHGFSVRCIREALPTGTGSNEKDGFRVFPNPSAGGFTASGSRPQRTLDLSTLAKGSYTLLVEHDGERVSQTVVVE